MHFDSKEFFKQTQISSTEQTDFNKPKNKVHFRTQVKILEDVIKVGLDMGIGGKCHGLIQSYTRVSDENTAHQSTNQEEGDKQCSDLAGRWCSLKQVKLSACFI